LVNQVAALGMSEVLSTSGAPWQRAYIERLIGTIRRECLDHLLVSTERNLRHHLRRFVAYYHQSRTHLALYKDGPEPRSIQGPEMGRIVAFAEVGGLHHRYERRAA
jgi:transposase InsO family protein